MQNVCLVTTQSFKGSLDARTFASTVCGYHVYQELFRPSIGKKLVAKREFIMDKQADKVVKGDETVG